MDPLRLRDRPALEKPILVAAFSGWPDAAEVASSAVQILIDRLGASRFGDLDPEPFFDFSEQRPTSRRGRFKRRILRWPSTALYAWQSPDHENDLILLLAPEPHLRWKTYCRVLMDLAESLGCRLFVTLGGTYDAVPHTARAKITGWASTDEWTDRLRELDIGGVDYEGPTGIHSALLEACAERAIPTVTIWGHSPQYVRSAPNPKVCHAALDRLRRLLGISVNLDHLRAAAIDLDRRIDEAVRADPELTEFVQRLEAEYEVAPETPAAEPPPLPDSATIVRELEEFLRGGSSEPPDRSDDPDTR